MNKLTAGLAAALLSALATPLASAQTPCSGGPICGACDGANLSQVRVRPTEVPPWTGQPKVLSFDAFDPSLGELVRAQILITPGANVSTSVENLDTSGGCAATSITVSSAITVDLDQLPSVMLTQPIDVVTPYTNLAVFDGTIDFMGPSGDSSSTSQTFPNSICIDDALDLDALTQQLPGDQITFSASTAVPGQSQNSGCGNLAVTFLIEIGLRIEVIYTYCPNDRPVLGDDGAETCEGVPVGIDVLANDTDPDGSIDCGSIQILSGPSNGSAIPGVQCNGLEPCVGCVVTYTPNALFSGPDQFTYRVMDDDGCWSEPAIVTVDVLDAPIAVDDVGFSCQGDPVTVDVLANDTDSDGVLDCGTLVITTQPTGGTAQVLPQCNGLAPCAGCGVLYTPNANFSGSDSFGYQVLDSDGCTSNEGMVTISVNANPITQPDAVSFCEGGSVNIDVLANDNDPDGALDCGTLEIVSPPANGIATVSGNCNGLEPCVGCSISYVPGATFSGMDSFTYRVTDEAGCRSDIETVMITVFDAPTAVGDAGITCEDEFVDIDVLANDGDADGTLDCSSILITDPPDHGTAVVGAGCNGFEPCPGCVVRYTPAPGYSGPDSFGYIVFDDTGCSSNEALVGVTVRSAPVTQDDVAETCAGEAVLIDVLDNDDDPDGQIDCGSLTIIAGPSNGIATIGAGCNGLEPCNGCSIQYTPSGLFSGVDQFTYTVQDATGCVSDITTVDITVSPRPNTVDDDASACQGELITIDVLDNDSGPIDPTTVEVTQQPSNGSIISIDGLTGEITYRSFGDFCGGADTFQYRVNSLTDCESQPAEVRVQVRCGPVANDDSFVFDDPDNIGPVDIDVLDNDFDPDGPVDCGSLMIVSQPIHGTVDIGLGCLGDEPCDTCVVTYTPNPDFDSFDSFTYQIMDEDGCIDTAQVVIQLEFNCVGLQSRRRPGALLLYPEFDNREGSLTLVTVTNTETSALASDVDVEFVYRREGDCLEFNRTERLTPADTFSVIVEAHNPTAERGFLYAVARCPETGEAIAYNALIGQYIIFNGVDVFSYSVNAVAFEGIGSDPSPNCPQYAMTDVDGDGIHDLDGIEYIRAPDQIVIPRFIGQMEGVRSDLVLLGLSGGAAFTTTVDLLIFNDNEEVFPRLYSFDCWAKPALEDISGAFRNDFLLTQTNSDPTEILGAAGRKSGWILIDGVVAESTERQIVNPAVYAVLVECVAGGRCVADLPFELCEQSNGDLFPTGPDGDPVD